MDRPYSKVWRKQEQCYTKVFLYAVNWNCTALTIDWPENNFRITFIPSTDSWVIPIFRGPIDPRDAETSAKNAVEFSQSVYAGMARWAQLIFQRQLYSGYNSVNTEPQLELF